MKQASVSSTDHGGGKRRAGALSGDLNQRVDSEQAG
jgi:hypothetical protein